MKKYILSAIVLAGLVGYFLYSKTTNQNVSALEPGTSQTSVSHENINPAPTRPSSTPLPVSTPPPMMTQKPPMMSKYRDGTYTGDNIKFLYGNMQVATVISNGKIADINFLVYPNDNPNSIQINTNAIPKWRQEVIQTQQTKVSIVTQATDSGVAFTKSLDSALIQAVNS